MSSISAGTTSTTTLVHSGDTTGSLVFKTNDTGSGGTTAVTIDTSQNVGIGTTPSAWNNIFKTLQINTQGALMATPASMQMGNNIYYDGAYKFIGTGYANRYYQTIGQHVWTVSTASGTAGGAVTETQAMTLDSSGNLLVGQIAQFGAGKTCVEFNGATSVGASYRTTYSTSSGSGYINFRYSDNTQVGVITLNGTTGVTYGTTSDYRLKDNVQPMTGALAKVTQLKPVTYKWKSDGADGQGFIAHELQAVVPDCVTGEKDAVDADGNPIYQNIDTSFLVATLTAAIQEQQALINALTARVVALESK